MHVAVCFWGLLRSLAHTEPSIRDHCFGALTKAGFTFDVFVHSYRFEGTYSSERNHEPPTRLNFSEWQRLRPFYVHIEDQDIFDRGQNYSAYLSQGALTYTDWTASFLPTTIILKHLMQATPGRIHRLTGRCASLHAHAQSSRSR